ncbi:MAG: hypothetical protein V2I56_17350 [Desulfobacteraceae bacterium]|jgi:hypothetical protein|nr:hypothetical protein [Desulfobacteraceae bacterium]
MNLNKNLPYIIAGFVIAVGVFFCVSALLNGVLVDPEPPGGHFLIGISIIFIGAGIYFLYLLSQGKLKESGKPIVEVRKEAIEKMKDTALLAQIASEDEVSEIRKTAKKRLYELRD